ncbi:DUF3300 domain-containing protein [Pseudoxanthomonas dokdonensis]|uniref:DUF3300 domain-containing protein n=1 Tax=Pseudoxanthomonas dokdonensis TaxID=344882 RepID=A0A0R0D3N5_9GAMM|nr:DUF3300 domain-containing protein [Pseudoxanthomonas dokdonensis]KRG71944.1 hypothetical protein ABB29_00260 [Pseudoxanthomonas dokdonensis]
MRHPRRYALATALVLLVGCSRDESTTPAATPAPATPATTAADTAQPPANAPDRVFSQEELDQMVAPIALYPDPLLAQVLMASTYPGDVADAAKWSAAHPDATGDAAVKQVAEQPWDPSVQSLVAFPQALATLEQDPAWVTRLGDAFLAQPDEVMDAVQRLRRQAQSAGTLSSNEYQNVSEQTVATDPPPAATSGTQTTVVEQAPASEQVIVIQPSDPQTVYVPSYNPTTAYGSWPYPSYPPAYYPPPPRYYPVGDALLTGMAFGVGVAVVDSLWGEPHWGYHDYGYGGHNYVDIDVNRYNNINVNNRRDINQSNWSHNAVNRDGVPYRDRNSRQQYGRNLEGERGREAFRGDDPQRAEARAKARSSMDSRGLNAATSNRDALNSAREANRSGGVPAGDARDRARDAAAGRTAAGGGDAREHAREVAANRTAGSGDARDHARDVAANRTGGGNNDARQRAQSAAQKASSNPQARQKAQTAASKARTSPKASQAANRAKSNRSSQANSQARSQVRKQAAPQHTAPKNNAFQGASRPNATHAQASRGHASQAAARKPPASRPPARQVSRPAHPPQRSGGGGRRR